MHRLSGGWREVGVTFAREGHGKDYEFSGTSMREHWQSGYEDPRRTLKRQEWLTMPSPGTGIVVHDVHRQQD